MSAVIRYGTALISTYVAGAIGFLFIRSGWSSWYDMLPKPPLSPSSSIFFLAWLILYTLLALALGLLWNQTELWHAWIGNFFVALAFHAAWAVFFFWLHVILLALADLLCLILIVIALVMGAMEIDKRAGYIMVPFLMWLLFVFYLNAGVWFLS